MPSYYLRVEGVNLGAVLDDTDQLSVVRGGSLLLRQAVKDLSVGQCSTVPKLEPISTGASVGLFKFECDAGGPGKVRDQVAGWLNNPNGKYQHFTFVVDVQPVKDEKEFLRDKEAAIARNRFRQFQQVSVAIPTRNDDKDIWPCAWDGIRPADNPNPVTIDNDEKRLSGSTRCRYDYGLAQKKKFYEEEAGISDDFAHNLHQIADSENYGNLNDKIAVIYLDGNKFGTIQTDHCKDGAKQKKFDQQLQSFRRCFLKEFYAKTKNERPAWRGEDENGKDILRLETLLWGGDEMILVVPAWKGFCTLHTFFELSKDWKFEGEPLTHAGGLVFCHKKTPIYRARKLAHDLADDVKHHLGTLRENRYDYVVLETIDFPTEPVTKFRERVFGAKLLSLAVRSPLPPVAQQDIQGLSELLDKAPKAQAYALARAILDGDAAKIKSRKDRFKEVASDGLFGNLEDKLKKLFAGCNGDWPWLHLVDLWDYLDPKPKESRP